MKDLPPLATAGIAALPTPLQELKNLSEVLGGPRIQVNPNGVDLEKFQFRGLAGREPATLIFTGNMAYSPNEEAVCWFRGVLGGSRKAVSNRPGHRAVRCARRFCLAAPGQ